ncbi:hypothetical protein MNBD_GAMMA09-374 [hydrothermal vent metagenome]|uniref:Uncharacterized protein n=1 Tax=hydrothermal vent metagenome TaxID=652676 RepID=A0A3B0XST3_9ZZZZ
MILINFKKEMRMRSTYKNVVPLLLILIAIVYDELEEYSVFLNIAGGVLVVLFVVLFSEKSSKSK